MVSFLVALAVLGLLVLLIARKLLSNREPSSPLEGLQASVEAKPRPSRPSATQPAVTQIAQYKIQRQLGRGGAVDTYAARDEARQRDVHLKILNPSCDAECRGRFANEARILAALVHGAIPTLWELGEDHGVTFMATELVHGTDLHTAIREGITLRRSLPIMGQVLDALAYIHARGIVHRDIKPNNIVMQQTGGVKIGGFIIAQHVDAPVTGSWIVGTPQYMSPEQCLAARLDGRSDLYAVGCIIYELVVGCPPFRADTPHALLQKVIDEEPNMGLIPNSPEWEALRAVLTRSLRKNPGERYPVAAAMRQELEGAIAALGQRADWSPMQPESGSAQRH